MMGFINYYEVLEVAEDATQADITKAYRRAAMKWHPDRYKGPDATDKMALINEAYCILRDPEARSKYDQELFRYKQYQESFTKPESHSHFEENNSRETASDEYVYQDKTLEEWIRQAREKGKKLALQSLEDFGSIAMTGTKEFFSSFFTTFIWMFVIGVIVLLLFLASH